MLRRLLFHVSEDLIRGIGGPIGYRLRRFWYSRRFASCGAELIIEPDVHIVGAEHMHLEDNVWLDRASVLIAGPPRKTARIVAGTRGDGQLKIGRCCHIGIGCVIQAHGGVCIGDNFTASAGAKVYSFSNDPRECRAGTVDYGQNSPGYRVTPVEIGRNVWIGLDVLVIGARIGNDCFVRPKSIVSRDLPAGHIADGNPAGPLRLRFNARPGKAP